MTTLTRHRFSVDDYHRMIETGILGKGDHVELLHGEIVEMSPISRRHEGLVKRLNRLFHPLVPHRAHLGVQGPQPMPSDESEPQPDFTVLRPSADDYMSALPLPSDVLLLVEVAVSSQDRDHNIKVPLYSANGIGEVWVIDAEKNFVTVYRDPAGGKYQSVTTHRAGEKLSPLAFADHVIDLTELLA